jgi:lysozyme family protein
MFFDEAFKKVVSTEGGYVDHPEDPGGRTKWGISQRAFPEVDIEAMSIDECKLLYREYYWDALRADDLPPAIRYHVFDGAVNSGVGQSVRWLQRAVDVADDGDLGPVTLAAVLAADPLKTILRYNSRRLQFMRRLTNWPAAGRGWAGRIADNLEHSAKDAP